jgi:hypothetical protein
LHQSCQQAQPIGIPLRRTRSTEITVVAIQQLEVRHPRADTDGAPVAQTRAAGCKGFEVARGSLDQSEIAVDGAHQRWRVGKRQPTLGRVQADRAEEQNGRRRRLLDRRREIEDGVF